MASYLQRVTLAFAVMPIALLCSLLVAAVSVSALPLSQTNPPAAVYFRSDQGLGYGRVERLPSRLDAPGVLRWRTVIDPGHSTPIPVGGRLVVTSHRSRAGELAVESLDASTGKFAWRRAFSPARMEDIHPTGSLATPTPAWDGTRVFAFFGSYGLVALDEDGRVIWEKRMGPFQDEYGAGSSPIVADGRVIVQQDHDVDSFLAAYDAETGRELWRTARPDAVRSYSTPAIWRRGGRVEVLAAGALELCGYDHATGRIQWSMPGLARIVIPSPIPVGDRIFMASWAPGGDAGRRIALDSWSDAVRKWDTNADGGLTREEVGSPDVLDRFFRIDLDQNGKLVEAEWARHAEVFRLARNGLLVIRAPEAGSPSSAGGSGSVVWSYPRGVPYVSTPLVERGAAWMVKDGGIVTRLDATTGVVVYEERLPGAGSYYASPVAGDGKLYFASQSGVVSIVETGPEWRVVSSRDFREKIQATPLLNGRQIVIRTESALYGFAEPDPGK